jgi:hypothetical protein
MALFKRKSDPITERSKTLNNQIAALQAQIERLSGPESSTPPEEPVKAAVPEPDVVPLGMTSPHPRLRSTTLPHNSRRPPSQNPFSEPVFEDVPAHRRKVEAEPPAPVANDLGVRKYDFFSLWRRLSNHFRGPATSNPKLVNYLAAGSIQGLRPLRYEKRVARNRFIVLVVVLIAVLWGLIAVLMKRT